MDVVKCNKRINCYRLTTRHFCTPNSYVILVIHRQKNVRYSSKMSPSWRGIISWRGACHISCRSDHRWGKRVLEWRPRFGKRTIGRPKARWSDICAGQGRAKWREVGEAYVQQWTVVGWWWRRIFEMYVRSTVRNATQLQFDTGPNVLEIKAVQSL
jgi:hypothetical protein